MKKGFFFTLDMAIALFLLAVILSGQSDLQMKQSVSNDLVTKQVGQDVLNVMEKTGFLDGVALGSKSQNDVLIYLNEVVPSNMAANFSLTSYKYNGGFTIDRSMNVSTTSISQPFSSTRRITLVSQSGDYRYVITDLRVGYK